MDIAISAVIIILLLLPAFTFRAFIIQSDSLENPLDTSNKAEFGLIFMFALIQHLIGCLIIQQTHIFRLHFDQFFYILNGDSDKIQDGILGASFLPFLYYILIQVLVSIPTALLFKKIALTYYIDLRYTFIPITNEWDQLLSGRIFEYDRLTKINSSINELKEFKKDTIKSIQKNDGMNEKKRQKIKSIKKAINAEIRELKKSRQLPDYNYVEVDVLVNTSSGDMIYKGRIFKYYLAKDNSLDKLVLKDVFRRKFFDVKNEQNQDVEFYEFTSKLFVVKYAEIRNLNVRYTFLEEDPIEANGDSSKENIKTTTT